MAEAKGILIPRMTTVQRNAIGNLAGFSNKNGTMNTFLGMSAGRANRTGQYNIAVRPFSKPKLYYLY